MPDIPHIDIPAPPAAPPPVVPPPAAVPTPNQFNLAVPLPQNIKAEIGELVAQTELLKEKIKDIEAYERQHAKDGYRGVSGSLEEAEMYLEAYQKNLANSQRTRDLAWARLDELLNRQYNNEFYEEWELDAARHRAERGLMDAYFNLQQVEYWTAEVGARRSEGEKVGTDLSEARADLANLEAKISELREQSDEADQKALEAARAEATRLEEELAKQEVVSAGEIGEDDFADGPEFEISVETADITPDKTLQELREDSLRDAFSDLHSLEFQTGVLETADVAGQVTQTIVGFVPGATVADVALSTARGFAETLGEEMAKGTSWDDALKIASVNAGFKGAVTLVGNKLTAGADRLANRVAVLSEVGFSKLTTKQIAEYGSKGISFVVVKSTQTGTQELVGEFAGKPAIKKVADWIKDDKKANEPTGGTKPGRTGGGYGGGYGTSHATQPLVAY